MLRPLLLAAAILTPRSLAAWGDLGHRLVAQTALADLPPGPAGWFAGREALLADHANDPDHWKAADPLERPRHYLECEAYGGPGRVPRDREAALARLGRDLFLASGQLPWTILDRVQALAAAFRSGDPDRAALAAAVLCHYVGDASVPLHTTCDRHGHATGQDGIHWRWQVELVRRVAAVDGCRPEVRPADLGGQPLAAPWDWLRHGFALVPELLAADLAARRADPGGGYGAGYWQAFQGAQGPRVLDQLALGAQRTARMIVLAWALAGGPPAPRSAPAAREGSSGSPDRKACLRSF
jgi:hypothetical protein